MPTNKQQLQNSQIGQKPERIFEVAEYLEAVNIALKKFRVKITGEVTEITDKGHIYFSLKDKVSSAVVNCIIWQSNYRLCGVKLEEGLEVILSGSADIYPPSGRFAFKADTIELKGEGALKKAYLALKARLEEEGLFAIERKRALPDFPQKIGVITSREGAVINDFLNNLGRFGFQVSLINSRVQGQEAIAELISAIQTFQKKDIDVLAIMRGGGSLEDLQAFNNEALVREVVGFNKPVIAAIGHDKDVPLLALAADSACSTPTAAANLLNQSWQKAPLQIHQLEKTIFESFSAILAEKGRVFLQMFYKIAGHLQKVFDGFQASCYKLNLVIEKLANAISQAKNQIDFLEKNILAQDPAKNLSLGYCITRKNGVIIKKKSQVKAGDIIDSQLSDGFLTSQVN